MCVGEGSVFLHSHLVLAQHFQFLSEPIYQPDFQIHRSVLDQLVTEEEVTQQAITNRGVADSAPISVGQEGWVGFITQTKRWDWNSPSGFCCVHSGTCY